MLDDLHLDTVDNKLSLLSPKVLCYLSSFLYAVKTIEKCDCSVSWKCLTCDVEHLHEGSASVLGNLTVSMQRLNRPFSLKPVYSF